VLINRIFSRSLSRFTKISYLFPLQPKSLDILRAIQDFCVNSNDENVIKSFFSHILSTIYYGLNCTFWESFNFTAE